MKSKTILGADGATKMRQITVGIHGKGGEAGIKAIQQLAGIRRTRFKTLIMTAHIDKAVEEIERRREAAGRGVEYKAFEMYFMQGMDYAEIAEELDTGKNTPRRWVTGIINELSVLLWGIDEERVK